ncbi:hypothetical protein F5B21DRAFT_297617 [Xylaria acuta]|nr:hypothetical protein F5B21DRAFT_297617 [Xylaria acuta]
MPSSLWPDAVSANLVRTWSRTRYVWPVGTKSATPHERPPKAGSPAPHRVGISLLPRAHSLDLGEFGYRLPGHAGALSTIQDQIINWRALIWRTLFIYHICLTGIGHKHRIREPGSASTVVTLITAQTHDRYLAILPPTPPFKPIKLEHRRFLNINVSPSGQYVIRHTGSSTGRRKDLACDSGIKPLGWGNRGCGWGGCQPPANQESETVIWSSTQSRRDKRCKVCQVRESGQSQGLQCLVLGTCLGHVPAAYST